VSYLLANLAAAPFVNKRPVQRFMVAAWLISVVLATLNVVLWLQYRHDSTALRARLAETRSAIEASSRNVVEMDRDLDGLDLAAQNAQVDFLNDRIAERTFPWSLLFERIAATLPDGVRLMGLNPVFEERDRRRQRAQEKPTLPEDELVDLKFEGAAKSDEELYELIDAFFSSPAFDRPRLHEESRDTTGGGVRFTVDVRYRPRLETSRGTSLPREPDGEPSRQPTASRAEAVVEAGDEVSG
jgi:Tfp pilus assembly protein PilN